MSVAIDPAPFRGVLPLPISALKSVAPVLGNPANRNRAVPLTYEQFRYAFGNAVSEGESQVLYEQFTVPASGRPLFQAAAENLNPWTEAKVDHANPSRGSLLLISGEKDHTVPPAIVEAEYKKQMDNKGVTEFVSMPDRGHALTIEQRVARSGRYVAGLRPAVPGAAGVGAQRGTAEAASGGGRRQFPLRSDARPAASCDDRSAATRGRGEIMRPDGSSQKPCLAARARLRPHLVSASSGGCVARTAHKAGGPKPRKAVLLTANESH